MTRILTASVLAALMAAVACGGGTPSSPSVSRSVPVVTGGSGVALGTASIGGTVIRSADSQSSAMSVSVAGTALASEVDNSGTFQLAGVPSGDVRLVFGGSPAGTPSVLVSDVADEEVIELQVGISGSIATVQRELRDKGGAKKHDGACQGGAKPGDPVPGDDAQIFDNDCKPIAPVEIKKLTNGRRVDQTPGPTIGNGNPIVWTYQVTNRSPLTFTSLTVIDDRGVAVSCPRELPPPGATVTCTGNGTATLGQYRNVGTVTITANGRRYIASDVSYYFGVPAVGVTIRKFTNGQHVTQAPGPSITVGSTVSWTYEVTNVSPAAFSSVSVTDDRGVVVACPRVILEPAASMTCTGTGVALAGQYHNVGTVVAFENLNRHTASDDSFYFGVAVVEDEGRKVDLCHKTGNGSYHMIDVSVNAEPAHRGHGDAKVGEAVPGKPGFVFTPSCGVVAAPTPTPH